VSDDHEPGKTEFNGRVHWVQLDLGEDAEDADHLITPEERMRVAMSRQ
jgi:arylsulfatase